MRLGGFTIAGENCGKVGLRNQPCRAMLALTADVLADEYLVVGRVAMEENSSLRRSGSIPMSLCSTSQCRDSTA
jgi:hypothetical protein